MNSDEAVKAYNAIRNFCNQQTTCYDCPFQDDRDYVQCFFESARTPDNWPESEDIL